MQIHQYDHLCYLIVSLVADGLHHRVPCSFPAYHLVHPLVAPEVWATRDMTLLS